MIDDKKNIRREVRTRLSSLSDESKEQKSLMLSLVLAMHPRVRGARVVALFSPLPDEPQITEALKAVSRDCRVVLPRVEGDIMRFYPYSPDDIQEGAFGIMEPMGNEPVAPESIEVMVVPGVAFTAGGLRLGRGKGYYDRYMSQQKFRAYKIGLCYEEQVLSSLPVEPFDVRVDELIYR